MQGVHEKAMDSNLLEKILTISRRMAETRALAPLLDYVVDEAIQLTGAERGFIVLKEPDGTLEFRVKRDRTGQDLAQPEDQVSKSILNKVIETGESVLSLDAMTDARFDASKSVADLKLRSIMCAPLIVSGDTIGAVYVENRSIRGRFDNDSLSPLTLFANQAAISIENAKLIDVLEERVAARTSELRQALEQLEENWAQIVEANETRVAWMNNVIHDLRTGLTVISGALTLLQMPAVGALNDKQLATIGKAADSVEHTLSLINDLFDFSKLEAGGLNLYLEVVSLTDFLHSVYDVGQGLPWPDEVTLRLDLAPQLPDIPIDPVRIRQVLLNLLSNANKYTSKGSVTLYAHQLEQNEILLGVADTGEGIEPDMVNQLFERFFQQTDADKDRQRKGTGLGLAISKALVELHGGRIWVESTLSFGSNFMFTLPVNPAPTDAEAAP
jgi:signal transduction histidine kinase